MTFRQLALASALVVGFTLAGSNDLAAQSAQGSCQERQNGAAASGETAGSRRGNGRVRPTDNSQTEGIDGATQMARIPALADLWRTGGFAAPAGRQRSSRR